MNATAMLRCKIIATLLVVAVSSGWIGSIFGARMRDREIEQARRDQSSIHLLYLHRLEEALHLSSEQSARIKPTLGTAAERTRKLSAQTATEAAHIREDMRAAITPVLTPEQRTSYEKFEAYREARHDRVRSNVRSYLDRNSKPSTPASPAPD